MTRRSAILAPATTGRRRRRGFDHAHSAVGDRTPYRFLGTILGLIAVFSITFGIMTTDDRTLRMLDLGLGVLLGIGGAVLAVLGPRASSGWPLDLTLVLAYSIAAYGTSQVPDDRGQLVVGFGLVIFGAFAGVFRPRRLLYRHLALMLALYWIALAVNALMGLIYFIVVASVTCGIALMVSVLAGRLRQMALHDSLTGVLNRRGLEVMSDLIAANAARTDTRVTVGLIDLDQFKSYNDSKGHMAGDARLIELAWAWESELRETDLVARFGGDEFALVLPGASHRDVDDLVTRVRERVSAPFSIGVTTWIPHEDLYVALNRADAGMFRDKDLTRQVPPDPDLLDDFEELDEDTG